MECSLKFCHTDGGSCLTLEPGQTDPNPSGLVLDGKGSSDFFDQLTLCTYSQDISGCNPSSGGYYNAMKDFLIQGDTGAMELYAGFGLPVCGTTSYVGDGPTYCDGTSEETSRGWLGWNRRTGHERKIISNTWLVISSW